MSGHGTLWNLVKTVIFLAVFWFVFVFLVPIGISILEVGLGIQRFPPQPLLAGLMLLGFTLLAAWSALTFAIVGRGTPLPVDPPATLVTRGPYAYLRHPFAAAATGQVVSLGIALGSVPVIAYAVVALAAWYFFVRPREEHALEERFGDRMLHYRRAVRGFRPRLTPYRVP
jgi:protein-S-isoprenylcysteine O-methyltransferase Ste14